MLVSGKNIISIFVAIILLVVGIALILAWWENIVILFKAVIGIFFALAGLLLLYLFTNKQI